MANQMILFTVMPRGITFNAAALPVSVYVAPRLMGANDLGSFPDWLSWTRSLKDNGLTVTFRCGAQQTSLPIATAPLRPELWEAMFNARTFVRSHTFDDYSERAILSYDLRYALSSIKSVYQQAGIGLALPDRRPPIRGEEGESHHRRLLKQLIAGFEVNWGDRLGTDLRQRERHLFGASGGASFPLPYQAADLGPDGLLQTMPPREADQSYRQRLAQQFAVCNHVPQGKPIAENPPDFDTLIDFHQALSSLNSYPALMRALGLVFDFELPADFIRPVSGQTGTLSVADLPSVNWQLPDTLAPPDAHPLETVYVFVENAAHTTSFFATAPFALDKEGPPAKARPEIEAFGLLNLNPVRYGLAQVDVDGALHKTIMLAETWQDGQPGPAPVDHPEVFDASATLPALRSGGLSLFADGRALKLLTTFKDAKTFNDAIAGNAAPERPFYAEDLVHGYRLDIWDSRTNAWHSLHQRHGVFAIGDEVFTTEEEEGFSQLAATQAAPDPDNPPPSDLYLHEAIARWAGWSLSVPMPGKHLSSDADPDKALDNPKENEPATPFKMTTAFTVTPGSLPSLRFGRRYRLRARVVDICGNSLAVDDGVADVLSHAGFALPGDVEGFPYLRYEPVAAPIVVVRDGRAITDPGSSIDRLVIRTFNGDPSQDRAPADRTAADRHLVPPRTSVDTGERLSMFDDAAGRLVSSTRMYALISDRDKADLDQVQMEVAGHTQTFPLEATEQIDPLPYLPDVLARGVALRDLPGAENFSIGRVNPPEDPAGALEFHPLDDPNPRPGSATLISFGGAGDWQKMRPLRLALDETGINRVAPSWDGEARVLTVHVPKATMSIVPLSSYLTADDLKLMGVWQWIREHVDTITRQQPGVEVLRTGADVDQIAHVLQRAVEGGHWMITPPRLLTLVHAVQQPLGVPAFSAISAQHEPYGDPTQFPFDETRGPSPEVLQTTPEKAPTAETELAPVTAWRRPGSVDAYLMGGLFIHGGSTEKVDILAEWQDPIDDVSAPRVNADANAVARSAHVDAVPVRTTREGLIVVKQDTANARAVGYYDVDHDLLCFVRRGDSLGNLLSAEPVFMRTIGVDAAPRHHLNDTKHHRITYTAVATSRFREYFPPDQKGGFTRTSVPIVVDVPASTRPAAPQIAYIVPTFGWQRQTETNLKRSVRFGGGLRVYLERGWFSSGEGELLGISLYSFGNGGTIDREAWKPYVAQWGSDPIWHTAPLFLSVPQMSDFTDAAVSEQSLSLEAPALGRVDVVGYPVAFDEERQFWYGDVTIDTSTLTYAPFVRLALARYQPHALPHSKLSRIVVADFAQLTPGRAAVVTGDPYHPRRLRVTVTGVAPSGPPPVVSGGHRNDDIGKPTLVTVSLQERDDAVQSDLGWKEAPASVAKITEQTASPPSDLIRWTGLVDFARPVEAGRYRLVIREYEYVSANYAVTEQTDGPTRRLHPRRLIYAETMAVDDALVSGPSVATGTTVDQ